MDDDDDLLSMPVACIKFDVHDPKECERAINLIESAIRRRHGAEFLWELLSKCIPTRLEIKTIRNARMLALYIDMGLSIEKAAAVMVADNRPHRSGDMEKYRGFFLDNRHGPFGTTNIDTMIRHIKREKRRMRRDPEYRKLVEYFVSETVRAFGPRGQDEDRDGDISK